MYRLILITALLVSPAFAEEAKIDCNQVHDLAYTIMKARQNGVSMPKAIELAGDNSVVREMVVNAYEEPRYNSQEFQVREMEDYAEVWYRECLKAVDNE